MNTPTAHSQILALLHKHHTLRPIHIQKLTGLSRQRIHSILKALVQSQVAIKKGMAPRTYYSLSKPGSRSSETVLQLTSAQRESLTTEFILIKKEGHQVTGQAAVCEYAYEHNLDPQKVAEEFLQDRAQAAPNDPEENDHLVELLEEKKAVKAGTLTHYNFADYKETRRFGATALAQRLCAAKSSQNLVMQVEIFKKIEEQIHAFIDECMIDAVAFVPSSTAAGKTFMREWKEYLDLPFPHINLVHPSNGDNVPQSAISMTTHKTANAEQNMAIDDHRCYTHVLLLDDTVLTGATLQSTAAALLDQGRTQQVSAFAIIHKQTPSQSFGQRAENQ